ncbi:MAG: hypothetical protein K9G26_10720 [Emcibacter sp.]|nr:hypothetical protein [Emcibacter sp.]
MKYFELTPAFLVGHEQIDKEHLEIIGLLNGMVDAFTASDTDHCQKIFTNICERLEMHFKNEAEIMEEFGFIDARRENIDDLILEKVKKLGNVQNSLADWKQFIFEMRHELLILILKDDLKFAEHLITIGYNDI